MPYEPFHTKPAVEDLTVRHAAILLRIPGPAVEYQNPRDLFPQTWLRSKDDIDAAFDMVELGLVACAFGIFYRTWEGERYKEKLYGRQ